MKSNFFLDKEDEQRRRVRIVTSIDSFEGDLVRDSSRLKFVCAINDDTIEEIFTYSESLNYINNSQENDLIEWMFKAIVAHEVQLPRTNSN